MRKDLFFSIVIPAHNEEKYIENTLRHLEALEYPNELYEVIVVENASVDKTYEKANAFASDQFHVFSISEPGVSNARNFGGSKANKDADWIFFLDADTFPDPPFLRSLSNFLQAHGNYGYVIGAAELQPLNNSFLFKLMYLFSNFGLRFARVANGSALFVKRQVLDTLSFDTEVAVGEDELFTRKVQTLVSFFFFSTDLIHTSTRRFENGGWKKIPVWVGIWLFAMIGSHAKSFASFQRRLKYEVVR
jgi:glycosyltransferase involved in cell wall biosynthesis